MDSVELGNITTMIEMPVAPWQFVFAIVMAHVFFVLVRSFLGSVAKASGRPVEHEGLY